VCEMNAADDKTSIADSRITPCSLEKTLQDEIDELLNVHETAPSVTTTAPAISSTINTASTEFGSSMNVTSVSSVIPPSQSTEITTLEDETLRHIAMGSSTLENTPPSSINAVEETPLLNDDIKNGTVSTSDSDIIEGDSNSKGSNEEKSDDDILEITVIDKKSNNDEIRHSLKQASRMFGTTFFPSAASHI